ncbi:MAG: hypothetical protein SR1Q7_02780 [Quinella sp. 1Q7]|nr:hypothetical protein [Quinella sp. 1Q7]
MQISHGGRGRKIFSRVKPVLSLSCVPPLSVVIMHRLNSTVSTKNFFMSSPHGNIKRYARQADQLHAQRITRRMKLADNFVRVEILQSGSSRERLKPVSSNLNLLPPMLRHNPPRTIICRCRKAA